MKREIFSTLALLQVFGPRFAGSSPNITRDGDLPRPALLVHSTPTHRLAAECRHAPRRPRRYCRCGAVLRSPDGLWEGRVTRHGAMVFPGWSGDRVGLSLRTYGEYSEAEVPSLASHLR